MTRPQHDGPVELQGWTPEGSWLENPEPQLPAAPRPAPVATLVTLCFSAFPAYLGVPAASLEGASGLLKGFWRAEAGSSVPASFGSLTQSPP